MWKRGRFFVFMEFDDSRCSVGVESGFFKSRGYGLETETLTTFVFLFGFVVYFSYVLNAVEI